MAQINCCCETPRCETTCETYLPSTPWLVSFSLGNGEFKDTWTDFPLTKIADGNCEYRGTTCDVDDMEEIGSGTHSSPYPTGVTVPFPLSPCCRENRVDIHSQTMSAYQMKLSRFRQYRLDATVSVLPTAVNSSLLRVFVYFNWFRYDNWNYAAEYVTAIRFWEEIVTTGNTPCVVLGDVGEWCQYDLSASLDVPFPPLDGAFLGGTCPTSTETPVCESESTVCGQVYRYLTCDSVTETSRSYIDRKKYRCLTTKNGFSCATGSGELYCQYPDCAATARVGTLFTRDWTYASDPFSCTSIPSSIVVKKTPYTDEAAINTSQTDTTCGLPIVGGSPITVTWNNHIPAMPKEFTVTL